MREAATSASEVTRATSPTSPAAHAFGDVPPEQGRAVERLFTPAQIAVATLLASPLAGALLAASNARALGSHTAARIVAAAGCAVTAAIFGVDAWGAGPFTLLALPAASFAAFVAATGAFGPAVAEAGARDARGVVVTIAAVWIAVGVVGGAVAGALQLRAPSVDEALADSVANGVNERVRFTDGARREDAEAVTQALVATGYFDGTRTLRLSVDRAHGDLRLTLRVPDDASADDVARARVMFTSVARGLAACVGARIVTPGGAQRAGGTLCP